MRRTTKRTEPEPDAQDTLANPFADIDPWSSANDVEDRGPDGETDDVGAAEAGGDTGLAAYTHRSARTVRRVMGERGIEDVLPDSPAEGESVHFLTHGDTDMTSFLLWLTHRQRIRHLALSTWGMSMTDVDELRRLVRIGRIRRFDAYVGKHSMANTPQAWLDGRPGRPVPQPQQDRRVPRRGVGRRHHGEREPRVQWRDGANRRDAERGARRVLPRCVRQNRQSRKRGVAMGEKPKKRVSEKQLGEMLRTALGNMSGVANELGISRQAVAERVAKSKELQAIREEAAEKIVDVAENKLFRAVGAGMEWAVKRVLDSKRGSLRGWKQEERHHIDIEARQDVRLARLDEDVGAEILARLAAVPEPAAAPTSKPTAKRKAKPKK